MRPFYRSLRAERYDICLDFQGLLRSGLISFASGAPCRVGFECAREGAVMFYTSRVKTPVVMHAVDRNLALVRAAFGLPDDARPPELPLNVTQEGQDEAERLLPGGSDGGPRLAVCFSSRWRSKNWRPSFIAEALDEAARRLPGLRCWLLGNANDRANGDALAAAASVAAPINLAGQTTFMGLAAMLRRSDALFTVDSGPMHLAAALSVPCVAMFGATVPALTGPYGPPGRHVVIRSRCPHAPCMKRDCVCGEDCPSGVSAVETGRILAERLIHRRSETQ